MWKPRAVRKQCFRVIFGFLTLWVLLPIAASEFSADHPREFRLATELTPQGGFSIRANHLKKLVRREQKRQGHGIGTDEHDESGEPIEDTTIVTPDKRSLARNGNMDVAPLASKRVAAFYEQSRKRNQTNQTAVNTTKIVELTKDQQEVASYIGLMLVGSVTFIVTLFYGTHYPDPDISYSTWKALSTSACVFSAVFIFQAFKDVMVYQFGEKHPDTRGLPDLGSLIVSFVRLFLIYALVQVYLMKYRRDALKLKAWGMIGGYTVAFAAIDTFGMLALFKPFRDDPAKCFLVWLIAAVFLAAMAFSAQHTRKWIMTYEDDVIKDHELAWDEQCKDTENQNAGIVLGFVLSMIIRFAISGSLPPVNGSPQYKDATEVEIFLGVSLGMVLPVLALAFTLHTLKKSTKTLAIIIRTMAVILEFVTMTAGWCLTYEGQWLFWSATHNKGVGLGDKMSARMVCALVQSYIGFLLILAIDFVADRFKMSRAAFDAVIRAVILSIALSWQGAFKRAVQGIAEQFDNKAERAYTDVSLSLFLCFIVVPAWYLYMLPRDLAGPQAKKEKDMQNGEGEAPGEEPGEEPGDDGDNDNAAGNAEDEGGEPQANESTNVTGKKKQYQRARQAKKAGAGTADEEATQEEMPVENNVSEGGATIRSEGVAVAENTAVSKGKGGDGKGTH